MTQLPTWIIGLYVNGPVSVKQTIKFSALKGWQSGQDPFYSDIEIENNERNGLKVFVSAFASTEHLANQAALFFFGQILDALAIEINLPISLSLFDKSNKTEEKYTSRRLITSDEWENSYKESWRLKEETFLRAMGWYRKGLYTEDPFDKFLAFWNSIEIIAGKYHPKSEKTKNKSKSQIWESFKLLWGDISYWPHIPNQDSWIDENYAIRKDIAHGINSVDAFEVERIINKLSLIEKVAYSFIKDWRANQLELPRRRIPGVEFY
jgi:hypothetical protein